MSHFLDRRSMLGVCAGALSLTSLPAAVRPVTESPAPPRGRTLKQSVARWTYGSTPLDELCAHAKAIGLVGIDLLHPEEWAVPAKHGIICTMSFCPTSMQIGRGMNRLENPDPFVKDWADLLPRIADAGIANMVVFSGNRDGQDEATGIANCVAGFRRLAPLAEKAGVTLCMEYLNSKVDHADYAFDRMNYGLEVCKQVGSPRVKILYDIYHAQIMEGDVIRTLRDHIEHIGHFHTGGVPGRNDIDDTQELYYPAICRAILDTGFDGFLAHEFLPKKDGLATLKRCADICRVEATAK